MKVITLRQPWASLVAKGYKKYETRSWKTHHRGDLVIHAAMIDMPMPQRIRMNLAAMGGHFFNDNPHPLPLGTIVAVVEIVSCEIMDRDMIASMDGNEKVFGEWQPLRWAWKLENVRVVKPYYIRGRQGLWSLSKEHVDKLEYL